MVLMTIFKEGGGILAVITTKLCSRKKTNEFDRFNV